MGAGRRWGLAAALACGVVTAACGNSAGTVTVITATTTVTGVKTPDVTQTTGSVTDLTESGTISGPPPDISGATLRLRIEGLSMVPTLTAGTLLAAQPTTATTAITRGDVVALHPPGNAAQTFVKRVIAVPGDVIEIVPDYAASGGRPRAAVLIKPGGKGAWQVAGEPYVPDQSTDPWVDTATCCDASGRTVSPPAPAIVPASRYFVLGDNRNSSKDSRQFGFVTRPAILGTVVAKVDASGQARAAMLGSLTLAPA